MPNRILRETILSSQHVCKLGWAEEVFYRRLMSVVDDYGRCEALPELLRARCYPLQTDLVRVADISRWIAACVMAGLIVHYELEGKQYLQIERFGQPIRARSKCPAPPASEIICTQMLASDSSIRIRDDITPLPPTGDDCVGNGARIQHADDDWLGDTKYVLRGHGCTPEEMDWVLAETKRKKLGLKPPAYLLKMIETRRSKMLTKPANPPPKQTDLPSASEQPGYQEFRKRMGR